MCCRTCGHSECYSVLNMEHKKGNIYIGYMFYHGQEFDKILSQIEKNEKTIKFYMGWDLYDYNIENSEQYSNSNEYYNDKYKGFIKKVKK